jgi:hypothetical protein
LNTFASPGRRSCVTDPSATRGRSSAFELRSYHCFR